ncbi:Vacuolar protein sorting-associated protein 29 [Yamadazyma tenuis]|uniref:Vacuolar protein sorting-associated protein 29 n=1 Tax=Candida tenuis TaxID=2315449 RepID=UPI0027A9DE87|nr:Vacuolar protein sorting-associated protein 29 [Yamadazyma tenuis]
MLTLAIGDLYIPDRAIEIPAKFRKLLAPNPQSIPSNNKISQVLCLGNVTSSLETLQFLHNLSPSFHLVRGEFDDTNILSQQLNQLTGSDEVSDVPNYKITIHDNLRIGFTNGYSVIPKNDPLSLSALARELDVDILIWGGTHKVEAYILDGKFFINPGSATGAFGFDWPNDEEDEEDEDEEDEGEEKGEEKLVEEEKETEEGKTTETNEPKETNESEEKEEKEYEEPASTKSGQIQKDSDPDFTAEDIAQVAHQTSNIPSFCLLETHTSTCTLYIYTYLGEEVKVDKVTYHKE